MARSRVPWIAATAVAAIFLAVRWPLLRPEAAADGLNGDMAILALMGKKMVEGRGFDFFCWGVHHLGSLSSMVAAFFGGLLNIDGRWPMAIRLAGTLQIAIGIAVLAWSVHRIDRRAAAPTALLLAIGPSELFRTSLFPNGHEMAFLIGAILVAIGVQHLTAPPGRGWLAGAAGRFAFGLVSGIGWWMDRTIAPVIVALLVVATLRRHLLLRDMRGVAGASAFILQWAGVGLMLVYLIGEATRLYSSPSAITPAVDALILIAAARVIHLAIARPRIPFSTEPLRQLAPGIVGFLVGDGPAWVAARLDRTSGTYAAGLLLQSPGRMLDEIRTEGRTILSAVFGIEGTPAGIVFAVILAIAVVRTIRHHRSDIRAFLSLRPSPRWGARAFLGAIIAATAFATVVAAGAFRSRYMLPAFGALAALFVLELLRWWDEGRLPQRALAGFAFGACIVAFLARAFISLVPFADHPRQQSPHWVIPHAVILDRTRALGCRVVYSDWPYIFRALDEERLHWIPVLVHDYTPRETAAALAVPGQRCFVLGHEALVIPIDRDLPLRGMGRDLPSRAESLAASLRKSRGGEAMRENTRPE